MQLVVNCAYRGTQFHGFARLPETHTVQGELERALSCVLRREIETVCAGRTDAGVHAKDQYCNFLLSDEEVKYIQADAPAFSWHLKRALNAILPDDIAIRELYLADDEFSCRFSACSRLYRYRIFNNPNKPLYTASFVWWQKKPLDLEAMNRAIPYLIGEHDFSSFCKARSALGKNTVRTIMKLHVIPEVYFDEELICVEIQATAFLHSMVRSIVGSLVEIGLGNRESSWMQEVLEAKSRSAAGPNAPAQGLSLWKLEYPESELIPLELYKGNEIGTL